MNDYKIECSWCGCLIKGNHNAKKISHGICNDCEKKITKKLEEGNDDK
jgi:hypothetical protein